MDTDIALSLEHVSIRYEIKNAISFTRKKKQKKAGTIINAVKDVSFSVNKSEVVGIIGENGSGKSTLLQAIAGIFDVDAGRIDTRGNRVSLLSLGTGFHNDLSARENIILCGMLMGYTKAQILERMDEVISFAELEDFIDYPVRTYSTGMRSRLTFSISMILDTDIILIDEVLSVGDESYKRKSYRKLRELIANKNHTVLLVSHNLEKLPPLCSRVIWMDKGCIKQIGDPETVIGAYISEKQDGNTENG